MLILEAGPTDLNTPNIHIPIEAADVANSANLAWCDFTTSQTSSAGGFNDKVYYMSKAMVLSYRIQFIARSQGPRNFA